jgi:indole-3-glycerol phosphate synthase
MAGYLTEIVATHREMAHRDERDLDELTARAAGAPVPLGFSRALAPSATEGLAVIAEVKRRSPSKGVLDPDLDPAETARAYLSGGAACLSVLTDTEYFGGSPEDLRAAKAASGLPTLRKDFTVSRADICDARLMGADAVLLIVDALDDAELSSFLVFAATLELDALVEVHDEPGLDRALTLGATLVGVNQRDLHTFTVDQTRACRLASRIPSAVVAVAESGIGGAQDAARLADAGFQAILVGETLVRSGDRRGAVESLTGHRVASRRVHAA